MLSTAMEDSLKAIYTLQQEQGERVTTAELAEYLDRSSPTVTNTVGKLEDRGLVDREKYQGVELTEKGMTVALEVLRHHRLLEAYLAEHLGYDWADVHTEAETLEHHISEELERRIVEALDNPTVDPHGDPIPTATLEPLTQEAEPRLSEVSEREIVVVKRVGDRDADVLKYLADHGITPGVSIEVVEVMPFGMLTVKPADKDETVSLPENVAKSIRVAESIETTS